MPLLNQELKVVSLSDKGGDFPDDGTGINEYVVNWGSDGRSRFCDPLVTRKRPKGKVSNTESHNFYGGYASRSGLTWSEC